MMEIVYCREGNMSTERCKIVMKLKWRFDRMASAT